MKRTALPRGKPPRRTRIARKLPKDWPEWIAARDAKLARTPYCEACGMLAVTAHHLRCHALGKRDHSPGNLQSVCGDCHTAAHHDVKGWRERYGGPRPGEVEA